MACLIPEQEELAQTRSQIDDLNEQNANLKTENDARETDLSNLAREGEERSRELSGLRNRLTLAQQNWARERAELAARHADARDEFESARQAMQDWEVLAMEERSIREGLGERVAELEEQLAGHREAQARLETERNGQAVALDGLQRALQEIQDCTLRYLHVRDEADWGQYGRRSSESSSRTRKLRSRSYGSRSKRSKRPQRPPPRRSRRRRRSSSACSRSRSKPRRRTC